MTKEEETLIDALAEISTLRGENKILKEQNDKLFKLLKKE